MLRGCEASEIFDKKKAACHSHTLMAQQERLDWSRAERLVVQGDMQSLFQTELQQFINAATQPRSSTQQPSLEGIEPMYGRTLFSPSPLAIFPCSNSCHSILDLNSLLRYYCELNDHFMIIPFRWIRTKYDVPSEPIALREAPLNLKISDLLHPMCVLYCLMAFITHCKRTLF